MAEKANTMTNQARHWLLINDKAQELGYKIEIQNEDQRDSITRKQITVLDPHSIPILECVFAIEVISNVGNQLSKTDAPAEIYSEDFFNIKTQSPNVAASFLQCLLKTPWSTVDETHGWIEQALCRALAQKNGIPHLFLYTSIPGTNWKRDPGFYLFFPLEPSDRFNIESLMINQHEAKKDIDGHSQVTMEGFKLSFTGMHGYLTWERTTGFLCEGTNTLIVPRGGSSGPGIGIELKNGIIFVDFTYKMIFDGYLKRQFPINIMRDFFSTMPIATQQIRAIWSQDQEDAKTFAIIN